MLQIYFCYTNFSTNFHFLSLGEKNGRQNWLLKGYFSLQRWILRAGNWFPVGGGASITSRTNDGLIEEGEGNLLWRWCYSWKVVIYFLHNTFLGKKNAYFFILLKKLITICHLLAPVHLKTFAFRILSIDCVLTSVNLVRII